jgi:hypothetical protein
MKNQTRHLVALLGLVILLSAVSASGQAPSSLLVKVPFSFTVEHQQLPAGEYRIQAIAPKSLSVRSTDGKYLATVLTMPVKGKAPETNGAIVFHRYGNKYFLAQVWEPAQTIGTETYKTHEEVEVAKLQKDVQVAVLVPYAAPSR